MEGQGKESTKKGWAERVTLREKSRVGEGKERGKGKERS